MPNNPNPKTYIPNNQSPKTYIPNNMNPKPYSKYSAQYISFQVSDQRYNPANLKGR